MTKKIEGVDLSAVYKEGKPPVHPNVLERRKAIEIENKKRKKEGTPQRKHLKARKEVAKADAIELLTELHPKYVIIDKIVDKWGISKRTAMRIIEDAEKAIKEYGRQAQTQALDKSISTMVMLSQRYMMRSKETIEETDDNGHVTTKTVYHKDYDRLALDALKHKDRLLGLDRLQVDVTQTGLESVSDDDLLDDVQQAKVIGHKASKDDNTPISGLNSDGGEGA